MDYVTRSIINGRKVDPRYHTSACLSNSVDAFCDDMPDPGCICDGAAKIAKLNAADEARARARNETYAAKRAREAAAEQDYTDWYSEQRDHILGSDHNPDDYL